MNYENRLRKLKRTRSSNFTYSEDDELLVPTSFYMNASFSGHVPMKKESKKLRNIMSKNSLNKEEVLSIKKYRKELSESQKNANKLNSQDRKFLKACRLFMKTESVSIFDPLFNSKFNTYNQKYSDMSIFYRPNPFQCYSNPASTYLNLIKKRKGIKK